MVGRGNVILKVVVEGVNKLFTLHNVAHCPTSRFNLVSVGCLLEEGYVCSEHLGRETSLEGDEKEEDCLRRYVHRR